MITSRYVAHFALLLLTLVAIACKQHVNKPAPVHSSADSVSAFVLRKSAVNKLVNFPAELTALERADIFAKVTGYVSMIKVDIGDPVQRGQLLAVLDAPELTANYTQANAEVQTARSKYLGSLDTYKRILNASKVEGTVAANEMQRVASQMMADSSSLEAAKSRLAAIAQIRDYLVIRSPFTGTLTQRNVDPGTLVSSTNTKPLFVIENTGQLRLRIPVPEMYTAAIPDSSRINFTVEAQPGTNFKASLSRKAGALSLANRAETWEFLYQNTHKKLKPGMYATASLRLSRSDSSFLVPSTAVATTLEKKFIVRIHDGKTEWLDVKPGLAVGDSLEVFANITVGDTILLRATDEIKVGVTIYPKIK
jgi:RND family efflux transporter MFP subunit